MGGTIEKIILEKTVNIPFINDYFSGKLKRDKFRSLVNVNKDLLLDAGLSGYWIQLLMEMPADNKSDALRMLNTLFDTLRIKSADFDDETYNKLFVNIERKFQHLPNRYTSIFTEETRCAYALSMAIKPKNVVVIGSYYNYLAVFLQPGLKNGGTITCLDIDPTVSRLAENNMRELGINNCFNIICGDGEKYLLNNDIPIDLLIIDAYGPNSHENKRYHGKSIYAPILEAALPSLKRDSFVMAHNAEEGARDLDEFYDILADFSFSMLVNTTENIGVFQR